MPLLLPPDQHILRELEKKKILVFTPSRRVGGKRVVCYDDRFIVKLAFESDGVVVSNDTYRDLQGERQEWKRFIEERLLMYSFVNDKCVPPARPRRQDAGQPDEGPVGAGHAGGDFICAPGASERIWPVVLRHPRVHTGGSWKPAAALIPCPSPTRGHPAGAPSQDLRSGPPVFPSPSHLPSSTYPAGSCPPMTLWAAMDQAWTTSCGRSHSQRSTGSSLVPTVSTTLPPPSFPGVPPA